ncbi:DNA methyltransferase [Corticicoccus populi]|uniref:site-specific DNA-methyltransferase (adenine-specific) n=1 Tax=Corticicoccus populi TaxID=1812821 RepID=A0ABW5X092_9STAP
MSKKSILSITEIEDRTKYLVENLNKWSFIEEFLSLFDIPKVSIGRALSTEGDFLIKSKIRYRVVNSNPLVAIDEIEKEIVSHKKKPRYLITTDFELLYAKDTKTSESLAINFSDLPNYAEFFLAWNGVEKVDYQKENLADIKAAERFTKLYDELVKINPDLDDKYFNLFLIRSLFMYFSEDTEIIPKNSFTNILKTRTQLDGSNLNLVIRELFSILDVPENERQNTPVWLSKFPYVNGKIFKEPHHNLKFNTSSRKLLIEAGELLNWNEINPDILGAMIQTVTNKEERQKSGMHYTSVENIMKVIKPLFLDKLWLEYYRLATRADDYLDRNISNKQKREQQRIIIKQLNNLLERMSQIKFFDPACGAGNFLIITYKELRKLEIEILVKIREVRVSLNEKSVYQGKLFNESSIKLKQFSGIEIEEFAHEVAILSLYIAEHQMNIEMNDALADDQAKTLPLQKSGNIVQGNALLLNWENIVPHEKDEEIYIIGNPPYIGTKGRNPQNQEQKEDLSIAIHPIKTRIMDYIFGWFVKAQRYIYQNNAQFAFVSTNSLFQGEQTPFIIDNILDKLEISFAYPSFKWTNSAKNKAGVTVVIVGFSNKNDSSKLIFKGEDIIEVEEINGYLEAGESFNIVKSKKPSNQLPFLMNVGSAEYGDDNLILSIEDRDNLINKYPKVKKFMKKCINANDLVNDTYSYALWIEDNEVDEACEVPFIKERLRKVKDFRSQSKRVGTKKAEYKPWKFAEDRYQKNPSLILPVINSEYRQYIPAIFIDENTIGTNANYQVYNAPIWLLGIISSRMHMIWLRSFGGKLESRYRYSSGMVYNTFPIPALSTHRKNTLEEAVLDMLDIREEEGGTLGELYGGASKPMNERLRKAHEKIDGIVERAYKQEPFKSDDSRLKELIKLYKKIIEVKK